MERNFQAFYEKYLPLLRKIARTSFMKPDYLEAEDLVQEMCLDLWQKWQTGRFEDKTDSYLVQSCRFYLKNYLRKVKGKKDLVSLEEPQDEEGNSLGEVIPDENSDLHRLTETQDLVSLVRNNGLTPREKEVFELYLTGLNTREIGRRLGVSHVRVVKLQSHIREKVKNHL
jgi:RNA polymerase sigma factor (sigma-70 family)